jgi:hypothetical protein
MTPKQEKWNQHIRVAGPNASKFSAKTIEKIAKEGGAFWTYEGPAYNTDAYRNNYDKIKWNN